MALKSALCAMTLLLSVTARLPCAGAQTRGVADRAIASLIGNVTSATDAIYDARTQDGLGLDALRVIQGPRQGTFIGVFHDLGPHNLFIVRLAWSDDLITWNAGPILSMHGSMPTITTVGVGYLLAFESASRNGTSRIEVEHFASYSSLIAGNPDCTKALPRHLSTSNEGTPSFHAIDYWDGIDDSRIVIGFHYNTADGIDRNGIGVFTNFSRWIEHSNVKLNHAIEKAGVRGSIGARNSVTLDGTRVQLVEGQRLKGQWKAWRIFLYEPAVDAVARVRMSTAHGSHLSIGVPRASIVTDASGQSLLVLTAFVYRQGSPPGTHGELVWWRPA